MPSFYVKGLSFGQERPNIAVSVMGATPDECAHDAAHALRHGAQVVEWRADLSLKDQHPAEEDAVQDDGDAHGKGSLEALEDAVKAYGAALAPVCTRAPLLFTYRSQAEGGRGSDNVEARSAFAKAAIEAGTFDMVDVEASLGADRVRGLCKLARGKRVRSVVSKHVLDDTPSTSKMVKAVVDMADMGADMPKLAVQAYGADEASRVIAAMDRINREEGICPFVLLAMGDDGAVTRLVGQQFGSAMTFASDGEASAPGQLDAEATAQALSLLSPVHRLPEGAAPSISGTTRLACLIGDPVAHSASPAIHNASFAHLGVDARYLAFDVKAGRAAKALEGLAAMGAVGCNVTMPLKREAARAVDELSPAARLVGAVNTVAFANGRSIGHNTDGVGMMRTLARHGVKVEGAQLTVLGTGGAAAAVVAQAALDGAAAVHVFAHSEQGRAQAEGLAKRVEEATDAHVDVAMLSDLPALKDAIATSQALVNATNVGMGEEGAPLAHADESPVPAELIAPGAFVADAVYFPRETRLVRDAKARGNQACGGLNMLVAQAAESERVWLGVDMDEALARDVVDEL